MCHCPVINITCVVHFHGHILNYSFYAEKIRTVLYDLLRERQRAKNYLTNYVFIRVLPIPCLSLAAASRGMPTSWVALGFPRRKQCQTNPLQLSKRRSKLPRPRTVLPQLPQLSRRRVSLCLPALPQLKVSA
jgi:hypothetical protein